MKVEYDGTKKLAKVKVEFVRDQGLGRHLFWAHAYDKNWTLPKIGSSSICFKRQQYKIL